MKSLLHLGQNVITFRTLLHLGQNVITFRTLLHLGSFITFRPSTETSRSVYPFPLLFRKLSTVFFIDRETNETIPLHFRMFFTFLARKTLFE